MQTKPPTYFGAWALPVHDDVRPLSILGPKGGDANRDNGRHHFVSAVYMDSFEDERGWVLVYGCRAPHPKKPRAIEAGLGSLRREAFAEKLALRQQLSEGPADLVAFSCAAPSPTGYCFAYPLLPLNHDHRAKSQTSQKH